MISAIAFTQSKQLISSKGLINPVLIRLIARPSILMLNSQINSQIQSQLRTLPPDVRKQESTENIVKLILDKTVESMAQNETGDIYGFKPEEIPTELIYIAPDGSIDLTPMIDGMLPQIAQKLNVFIQKYALIAPFIVALLTFLILQPLMFPVNWIEIILTIMIFKILLSTGFLKIAEEQRAVQKLHL